MEISSPRTGGELCRLYFETGHWTSDFCDAWLTGCGRVEPTSCSNSSPETCRSGARGSQIFERGATGRLWPGRVSVGFGLLARNLPFAAPQLPGFRGRREGPVAAERGFPTAEIDSLEAVMGGCSRGRCTNAVSRGMDAIGNNTRCVCRRAPGSSASARLAQRKGVRLHPEVRTGKKNHCSRPPCLAYAKRCAPVFGEARCRTGGRDVVVSGFTACRPD